MSRLRQGIVFAALLALGAIAAGVALGMTQLSNPQFEKGRSSTSSVVLQETAGCLLLVCAAILAFQLVAVARGYRLRPTLGLVAVVPVLGLLWWFTAVAERAS